MNSNRRLLFSVSVLITAVLSGTLGYRLIEGWSTFDAFYMTVITLATVGYREVHDLSEGGKIFTVVLIIFGAGIIAYAVGSLVQFTVEGQLRQILGRRKVESRISQMKGHYIVCGYGRIGRQICREFQAKPVPFVVVENDPEKCEKLVEEGYLFVRGDATDDDTLGKAGICRARGLITAVTSDTANVYITLTARGLNPDLYILARSGEDGSEKKLKRAGANRVVSPYTIGATRMAHAILRPSVVDFIELATAGHNLELQMEEIRIAAASPLAEKTLISSDLRKNYGVIIVGIKRGDETMLFNPAPTTLMHAGDILITLGESEAISRLERYAAPGFSGEKA